MAEEENTQEQPAGGKSNKKLIIIIAIVALLSIGLSIGATMFFLGGSSDSDEQNVEEVSAEPVKAPAAYLELKPPFVVTYNVEGRQRYMQAYVAVMARSQSVLSTLELHMPLIRNRIIMLFSGQDFNHLQSNEGKEALRQKTLDLINGILEKEGSGEVAEQVLFTNFVMQ